MTVESHRFPTVAMARWMVLADSTGRYCGFSRWIFRCSRTSRSRICGLAFLISVVSFAATILFFLGGFHATQTRQEHVYSQELRLANGRPTQPMVNTSSSHRNTSRLQDSQHMESKEHVSMHVESTRTPANWTTARTKRTFVEKYRHNYSNNATEFFRHLKGIIEQGRGWKPSAKKKREFRFDIRSELGKAGNLDVFSLTKNNVQVGKEMRFYMAGATRNISQALWNHLPKDASFRSGQFQRCSVVGSSGILRGSGCGKEIDRSESVFRFNVAPVEGFEADVGSKTNFTTLNPTYVRSMLNGLKTQADRSQFGAVLKQFNGSKLWLPAFGVSGFFPVIQLTAAAAFDSKMVQPLLGHPEHYLSVTNLWRKMAMSYAWPTTGLYLILSLFDVCDQVNVFGFWPYETAINGSEVPYHYHNNIKGKKSLHSFDTEFKTLVNLFEQGIIKMHLGSCF
ncbi:CMP-N-acetylneuraminate-poly-alpha-2,8-sialyltransferase-like [Patiria miniata]|uniref:Uncharacterized protein n=1 Tax=Patiria miniata TaxID=46514 RepID=A0A914BNR6_PATMI|nr:CMP-N-acetylneuraminate-poly-alpha-2,8-sialyltransferase-like [Patiria miniata]